MDISSLKNNFDGMFFFIFQVLMTYIHDIFSIIILYYFYYLNQLLHSKEKFLSKRKKRKKNWMTNLVLISLS